MKELWKRFTSESDGQDLVEYTLMLAFVTMAAASMYVGTGGSAKGFWETSVVDYFRAKLVACAYILE